MNRALFQQELRGAVKKRRRFKTAFLLGAGLGTRLRPLTDACPKPLLEIGGRPLITYAMDHLLGVGVDRIPGLRPIYRSSPKAIGGTSLLCFATNRGFSTRVGD